MESLNKRALAKFGLLLCGSYLAYKCLTLDDELDTIKSSEQNDIRADTRNAPEVSGVSPEKETKETTKTPEPIEQKAEVVVKRGRGKWHRKRQLKTGKLDTTISNQILTEAGLNVPVNTTPSNTVGS